MCGITGFWSHSAPADELREIAARMAARLAHRGPDDQGVWVDAASGIALGFRRLSIIDLSSCGAQPMTSASGRFTIVFNGEIYNFLRLRDRLESAGDAPRWRGRGDTEVLLACIDAWGVRRTAEELIGMFAFAVWDARERTLSLVRDRAGVKPLYYSNNAFASELRALEAHPSFDRTLDRTAAALYAARAYVPAPWSIYSGVRTLEPGTILTIAADGTRSQQTYWDAAEVARRCEANRFRGDDEEAADALDELVYDAVGLRMIADVPLGVFLSGGADSSLVAAMMQRRQSSPIHTFTIGFEDARFDEAPFAREVARRLGSQHEELYVSADAALAVATELPSIYDEPFADTSAIPTYLVSRMARRSVTVALSGDGADELFGGYHRHFLGRRLQRRVDAVPRPLRGAVSGALALAPSARARSLARALRSDPVASYWREVTEAGLLRDELPPNPAAPLRDATEGIMWLDFATYLRDDILVKVDRASMAVSLEAREPLLDHRLIEFAWSLPLSMKIRDDRGKWIQRQVLRRYLPDELVDREKQGFGLPVAEWLRGPLRPWAEALLARDSGLFDPNHVRDLWRRHLAGEQHASRLWTVLMFEAWQEQHRAAF